MGRVEGKVAIITGAGSGLGRAAAHVFSREGASLVLADISAPSVDETASAVRQAGGHTVCISMDVASAADWQRTIAAAVESYGRLDILVNNAGIWSPGSFEDLTEEEWQRTMDVNLKSVWLGCKYAVPEMRKAGGGAIVNTASVSGYVGSQLSPAYGASKAGVILLSKSIALTLAKENIRVNCVCPGTTKTNIQGAALKDVEEKYVQYVPMGRMGVAEEQANAMLFLASDEASFITGTELVVDGGFLAK